MYTHTRSVVSDTIVPVCPHYTTCVTKCVILCVSLTQCVSLTVSLTDHFPASILSLYLSLLPIIHCAMMNDLDLLLLNNVYFPLRPYIDWQMSRNMDRSSHQNRGSDAIQHGFSMDLQTQKAAKFEDIVKKILGL